MDRRNFLKNTAIGLGGAGLFNPNNFYSHNKSEMKFDVPAEAGIKELQQLMSAGKVTSKQITQYYLERIRQLDKSGPKLKAFIELNPDALKIAAQMDAERATGKLRGPMHGIPVAIKDNINTADKMMTTAGSLALMNHRAPEDAFLVEQLRKAGAVIIGKTNLTEWSNFRSTRSVSGWSSRGGQTRNAHVLDRNPSGSSSGSAVAVAANLCVVAVGTETNGSIISPSSHNGVVGIKPTVGLVSRTGIIPISSTQDTAGPIARTVTDAAVLLEALIGFDWDDRLSSSSYPKPDDFTSMLKTDALKGKRIGIESSHLTGHEGVVNLFKEAIEVMKVQGATIVPMDYLKTVATIEYDQYKTFLYEFKEGINRYLEKYNAPIRSLQGLVEFNKQHAKATMPYFGQEIFERSLQMADLDAEDYRGNIRRGTEVGNLITDTIRREKLDAICGVSTGLPGCIDLVNGDYDTGYYFCSPSAAAGFPHVTVPMGKVHALPVGLSFTSFAWDEPNLIAIAYSYEQASKKRESPQFIPSLLS